MKGKENIGIIVCLLLLIISLGMEGYQKIQYHRTAKILTSIDPKAITMFKVHSYRGGTSSNFKAPDLIVNEFFQSLEDLQSYSPSHDTVASWDHCWSIELATERLTMQISFYIPSKKNSVVVGEFSKKVNRRNTIYYGYFQSSQLLKWYQKYRERWLEPEHKE